VLIALLLGTKCDSQDRRTLASALLDERARRVAARRGAQPVARIL